MIKHILASIVALALLAYQAAAGNLINPYVFAAPATPPVIAATNTFGGNSLTSPITVNLPASISSGDLLLMCAVVAATSTTFTPPSGWTELYDTGSASNINAYCAYKFASGSEGASLSWTTGGTFSWGGVTARVTGMHGSAAPEAVTGNESNTASPDPPSVTPSWGNAVTLWIAVGMTDVNSATVSAYPSNYTDNQVVAGTNARIAIAARGLQAASEDPGAYTFSGSGPARAATIAIRPQ